MQTEKGERRRKTAGIRLRIFGFMLGFSVLLLVVLWLFQIVFLDRFYTSIKLNQVADEADRLAQLLLAEDMDSFEASIRQRGDLVVELVDSEGNADMVGGYFPEFSMKNGGRDELARLYQQVLAAGGMLSLRFGDNFNGSFSPGLGREVPYGQPQGANIPDAPNRQKTENVMHARILDLPSGEIMLLVRSMVTPVNATVETLRVQLMIISALMAVLSTGIALLLAGVISRPIIKLNNAAAKLAGGSFDADFSAGGYREVEQLSRTLSQTAKELEKTENLRRDLVANVSHDLRTPLTLITGYAEMMRDIPGENTPENMQVIIGEAKRLSSLVSNLLDLSRLQSGTAALKLEPFNLTGEVRAILERFTRFSKPEGYTVVFDGGGNDVVVEADVQRVSQVVYNFLINAMTHGGQDKKITVRMARQGGRARLSVEDNGEGILPENLPYIWDRYYKMDKEHKRSLAGTGLGLAIVKGILEQHPGMEYGVESEPGKGSAFWFSLPVLYEEG